VASTPVARFLAAGRLAAGFRRWRSARRVKQSGVHVGPPVAERCLADCAQFVGDLRVAGPPERLAASVVAGFQLGFAVLADREAELRPPGEELGVVRRCGQPGPEGAPVEPAGVVKDAEVELANAPDLLIELADAKVPRSPGDLDQRHRAVALQQQHRVLGAVAIPPGSGYFGHRAVGFAVDRIPALAVHDIGARHWLHPSEDYGIVTQCRHNRHVHPNQSIATNTIITTKGHRRGEPERSVSGRAQIPRSALKSCARWLPQPRRGF
jgi:hypothetical protein